MVVSGDKNHRQIRQGSPHTVQQHEAVQVRHFPVQHQDIDRTSQKVNHGGERVGGARHQVPLVLQGLLEQRHHFGIIVHHQHPPSPLRIQRRSDGLGPHPRTHRTVYFHGGSSRSSLPCSTTR